MSVSSVAEQAYTNYQQAELERTAKKSLLRIVGKADQAEFEYGQSIWIVERDRSTDENIVSELMVYAYSLDRVCARRLNGVRTSVSREEVIFVNEDAARSALKRRQ